MQVLLNKKEIVAVADNIVFGVFDEPIEKWAALDANGQVIMYFIDHGFTLIDGVELPEDFEYGKYFFEDGRFVLDENWRPHIPEEVLSERVARLEETVAIHEDNDAELLYQICLLQLGIAEDEM